MMKLIFRNIRCKVVSLLNTNKYVGLVSSIFPKQVHNCLNQQDFFFGRSWPLHFFGGLLIVALLAQNISWQAPVESSSTSLESTSEILAESLPLNSTTNNEIVESVRSKAHKPTNVDGLTPSSSSELISMLKKHGLYDLKTNREISPLLVNSLPADLAFLDVSSKKRVFFNTLLPIAMVAMEEVRAERVKLIEILEKITNDPAGVDFSTNITEWQNVLSSKEIAFVKDITRKYRHSNAAQLLNRIDVVPLSLVLAQGAIESSWGTSRFASLGNNLFGMWTWGEKGIVPLERAAGKNHKVAAYDSLLASARAYILTINRLPAYERLRQIRRQTMDPMLVSNGLLHYSERKEAYVNDLRKVISYNNLTEYDDCRLMVL